MIWGHVNFSNNDELNNYFSIWYHAFHMPVFYVISGYFFNCKSADEISFIRKKAQTLLIPYFSWGFLHIAWNYLLDNSIDRLKNGTYDLFICSSIHTIPIAGALWFLAALFWINIMYFYINKFFKSTFIVTVIAFIISIMGIILVSKGLHLPFCLDAALIGICFMAFGRILRIVKESKYEKYVFKMNFIVFLVLSILVNTLFFINGMVNYRSGQYAFPPVSIFNALMASVLLWNLARFVDIKGKKYSLRIRILLSLIGENSLIYVCLNQWFIRAISVSIVPWADSKGLWIGIIFRMIVICMVTFCCHIAMMIILGFDRLKILIGSERNKKSN